MKMDTNARPRADGLNSNDCFKERLARKVQIATDRVLLEEIKWSIEQLDPLLNKKSPEFRLPVLLTAAAFVGPDIDRLVSVTRYSRTFVENVSRRMREMDRRISSHRPLVRGRHDHPSILVGLPCCGRDGGSHANR
jgi:hypothetical protein